MDARTVGFILLACVVVLVLRYWDQIVAACAEFGRAYREADAARSQRPEVVSFERAQRELARRARGRVLEVQQMRTAVSGDSDPNRAA
jgi:hypothetical protein